METRKLQPRQIIKCPHCGWEYLPGEIFYPENVVGHPKQVIRDALGKILYEEYKEDCEPLSEETYVCDGCGKEFVVEIETKFKTKEQEEQIDFTSEYVSLI